METEASKVGAAEVIEALRTVYEVGPKHNVPILTYAETLGFDVASIEAYSTRSAARNAAHFLRGEITFESLRDELQSEWLLGFVCGLVSGRAHPAPLDEFIKEVLGNADARG